MWHGDLTEEIEDLFAVLSVPQLTAGFGRTRTRGPDWRPATAEAARARARRAANGARPEAWTRHPEVRARTAAVVAAVASGRTCATVAAEFGISHAAVRKAVSRARGAA
jgi:DNA-binding NarL/FixJ family response regulator